MKKEIWRDVTSFNGVFKDAYQVSNLGNVMSKDRLQTYIRNGKEIRRFLKGKPLTPICFNTGYLFVNLGTGNPILIHRIVAQAFPELVKGTWFPGAEVDHKDGNPLNNSADNLKWCTHKENINNPITLQRKSEAMVNRADLSKAVIQLSMDGTFIAEFPSTREAERQTGVNNTSISDCCNGKHKSAGGYKWIYKEILC